MVGRVLDDTYRLERLLGEGSFGVVYGGRDVKLNRPVAIKMLSREATTGREAERFLHEARNMASLNHPHVVQIYRLGEVEGQHYIVMEMIDGRTLADIVRTGDLTLRERLAVMRQVAGGLHALHSIGLLHRDLSTNNIMVTPAGVTKILDLGLSKDTRMSLTDTMNVFVGTVPYFSPEQVDGRGSSPRSELFSFGVILYEVVAGENPFRAEQIPSALYNIAHRDPPALEERASGCPPALGALVRRCLAKEPEGRPADAREIELALDGILGGSGLEVAVPHVPAGASGDRRTPSNPYLGRVMIKRREDFFGRRHEVQRIFARLNAVPPGSISIVGDRKIGKSSLLNHIYMPALRQRQLAEPERMVMVFLDLQVEKSMSMESFVRSLVETTGFELRGRLAVSDCAPTLDGVKDMIQRLDGAGYRLAILLDEFDAVTTNPNFDLEFFSFLRFLANHYNVAYITSSARNLQVLCHTKEISDSPFFNIFSTMRLTAFDRAEAEELIRVPSARVGRPLEPHQDRILELSGHFPFYIQMACSHAIEFMEEHPDREPDFAAIRKRFYEEARHHYQYIWQNFDEHERDALSRVAGGRRVPDSLRHVVEELGSRGYITGEDKPKLFSLTFEHFVLKDAGPQRGDSLLSRWFGRRG